MTGRTTRWSDGKSAMLCAMLALVTAPIPLLVGPNGGIMYYVTPILLLFGMAFFWPALWHTRGRDVWAWMALLVGSAVVIGASALTMRLGD